VGSNSEIQGYKVYPMLHFHRRFSSSITMWLENLYILGNKVCLPNLGFLGAKKTRSKTELAS